MGQTLIEKIVNRFAVGLADGQRVFAGDYITIRPLHVMTHDNTAAVIPKFQRIGATKIADPGQPVFTLDHDIQNTSPANLAKYAMIESWAREHGIAFYKAGSGIGHQVMVEEGYVQPGTLVVASDSHSNLYGAVAALGTPVVRTDAAAIWATGETWWQIPEVVRVELTGRLQPGVVGKDVIITLCGVFNQDEVLNCAVEFQGDGVAALSMDQRLTIANMTTEWGALTGVFPFDETLRDYLLGRARHFAARGDHAPRYTVETVERWYAERLSPDPDAYYSKELVLDLAAVSPHVAGPNGVKTITSLSEMEPRRVAINKAYLLSCVNARLEDLAEAAGILKDAKVAPGVKFYVAAASAETEQNARRLGHWDTLLEAGAIALPSGCGPCIGLGEGTVESGEVAISATNRNFKGRMGDRDAQVYLASPAVVAASAAAGYICGPTPLAARENKTTITINPPRVTATVATEILDGFPAEVSGRLVLVPQDNLNTDGIYGKDYTYREDMTADEMGKVAMLNYDPDFQSVIADGDILVGGRNFGTGSSREQAATALAFRGIRMVIAASFSQTYKRNAFNNGLIVFECPDLVDALLAQCAAEIEAGRLTIATDAEATVHFERSVVAWKGATFTFAPLGTVPQRLIIAGGTEAQIRARLACGSS